MGRGPETKVKEFLLGKLKGMDILCLKIRGMAGQHRGIPDILACCCGLFVGIELKADTKKDPTPLQKEMLEQITRNGGLALVVKGMASASEAAMILEDIGKGESNGPDAAEWHGWWYNGYAYERSTN